jgi:hypothetical protein
MRKSTLFISAALTTFVLVVMFGVVSAYQNIVKSTQQMEVQAQPTAVVEMVSVPIPTQVTNITAEAAAALASQVINRTDLFSAEITQFNGADVYLITFSSGDIVYVSFDGQILSISKIAVTVINQPAPNNGGGGNGGNNGNNSGGGEHEDGEHEGDDD